MRNSSRRSTSVKHLRDSWGGQVGGDGVLLNVVCNLQVEESRADAVAADLAAPAVTKVFDAS